MKKDAETGKVIPASGIGFKVRNTDTGEYVIQHINYPTPMDIEIYYTDANGKLMLPYALPYGNYEIIEQNTCFGYVLDSTPVAFKVDGSTDLVGGDIKGNLEKVKRYTRYALMCGTAPVVPHFYALCLDDNKQKEREVGLAAGLGMLWFCDELWLFGDEVSEGMQMELNFCRNLNIKIKKIQEKDIKKVIGG